MIRTFCPEWFIQAENPSKEWVVHTRWTFKPYSTSDICVVHIFLALYIKEIGLATSNSISFLAALVSLFHALAQVGLKSGKVWFLMCLQGLHSKAMVVMIRPIPCRISIRDLCKEHCLKLKQILYLTVFTMSRMPIRISKWQLLLFKHQTLPFADVLAPFSTCSMLSYTVAPFLPPHTVAHTTVLGMI